MSFSQIASEFQILETGLYPTRMEFQYSLLFKTVLSNKHKEFPLSLYKVQYDIHYNNAILRVSVSEISVVVGAQYE